MALDLMRISLGLDVESADGSTNAYILEGNGLPGVSVESVNAPIGSVWMRTDAEINELNFYYKFSLSAGNSADWKQTTSKEYVDAIAAGLSWREPALVHDTTAYTDISAAQTAANTGNTVDGISINVGDRILFSNIGTAGGDNIYIVSGSAGAWTFTEDTNQETAGDAVLINSGTHAEEQWTYDGTAWVQFGSAAGVAELGFLRAFIGKTGPGSEFPTFTIQNNITTGDNLELAVDKLDVAAGSRVYTNDNVVTDGEPLATSIDALDTALGNQTYTNDNVVTDGQTTTQSIDALDTAIGNINNQTSVFNGTTVAATNTTVDTIPLASATEVQWMVQVRETGTPANRRAYIVHAFNDGSTLVDFNRNSLLKLGSPIAGLSVTVDINATDMRLRVIGTNALDFVVKRLGFTAF